MVIKTIGKILLLLLLVYIFVTTFHYLLHLSDLDINQINVRRSYYPKSIGKIFQNKVTQSFLLSKSNFFRLIHD
jgi:hypothetical protein